MFVNESLIKVDETKGENSMGYLFVLKWQGARAAIIWTALAVSTYIFHYGKHVVYLLVDDISTGEV